MTPSHAAPANASADDRTVLAAERTFASWLRTGLAFLSVGLGLVRFLEGRYPAWQLKTIGTALILCAVASFAAAGWRDLRTRQRLREAEVQFLPRSATLGMVFLLLAVSTISGVALLLG